MSEYDHSHLPERAQEQGSKSFFEQYNQELSTLFDVLDTPISDKNDLNEVVATTQLWVSGDHSRPGHQFAVSNEQSAALHGLYESMGLKSRQELPGGHYDHLIVPGAIQYGNNRRMQFLQEALARQDDPVTADTITVLGGQRRMFVEKEKDDLETALRTVQDLGRSNSWSETITNDLDNIWETDMIRISAMAYLGTLTLQKMHLRSGNADPIKRYEFGFDDSKTLHLLHTLAVARKDGDPRHTTEACAIDWVRTFEPEQNARVAFIGANPHLRRMAMATRAALKGIGREDLQLIAGGPAAPESIGHSLYLGEVARNLYEDKRVLKAA